VGGTRPAVKHLYLERGPGASVPASNYDVSMVTARDVGPKRYTLAEFLALPEGTPGELVGGYHRVSPAPFRPHQHVVGQVFIALSAWALSHRAGQVYVSPFDVVLDEGHVLQPDVLFVSNARKEILRNRCEGAPDLVVEVISKDPAYDRVRKLPIYARFGVARVWLVDAGERTFECLTLDGASYRIERSFAEPDLATPPGFEGLEIPLGPLFELP
jgi:Uma2 family endonuclease